mmetsp:Transcript_20420/g.37490  ORF Transcript_20420/g.37490 Transcript_20420/m.37490 type:complete len:186 (+) Transcript_20420:142-699(+)
MHSLSHSPKQCNVVEGQCVVARLRYPRLLKSPKLPSGVDFFEWSLIHVGLAAVRYTKENPSLWVNSFIAVNLHPRHMLSFSDWCKKISPFVQSADSFDLVTQNKVNEYKLLPAVWRALTPLEKGNAVEIFKKHNSSWCVECIIELRDTLKLSLNDMSSLQVAIWLAIDDPAQLQRGLEDDDVDVD